MKTKEEVLNERINKACEIIDSMENILNLLPGIMTEDLNNQIQAFYAEIKYADDIDNEMKISELPFEINKSHEQGVCPVCGYDDMDYSGADFTAGDQIAYNWTCNNCKSTGTEWYDMKFIEHNNITSTENLITEAPDPTMTFDLCTGYEKSSCCSKLISEENPYCDECKEPAQNECVECPYDKCPKRKEIK